MTKQEIVDEINMLGGPRVTTRARKEILLEILRERKEDLTDIRNTVPNYVDEYTPYITRLIVAAGILITIAVVMVVTV